ncbi:MAG: cytochrome c biogenesis protein ResB [Pelomonas sp.]|nr:cytochrome c biogenesis protein ResB [Roseateles sp.]
MRFAISLLSVIAIAAITGTIVEQGQPFGNYVDQFGPFWAELFRRIDLYTIYGSPWFMLILGFLVVSTSLCIARNAPKIVRDLKSFKEQVREQSLQAHHHKALGHIALAPLDARARVLAELARLGWRTREQQREHGIMIAGRRGAANKLGYIAAHSAIVLILLAALGDGDLLLRALMWAQGKQVYAGSGPVLSTNVLPASSPSFRGTLQVAEGDSSGVARLNLSDGPVLQELPFDLQLRKFRVEFYPTGQPRLFASDIVLRDKADGRLTAATVEVNKPVVHDGVTIFQSGFDDGGSKLKLSALPMRAGASAPFTLEGAVGGSTRLTDTKDQLTLEFAGLRVMNVESFAKPDGTADAGGAAASQSLAAALDEHLGSGAKASGKKDLRNVGPSFSYRLRDAAGQAREYNNYVAPIELDGQLVFLAGVRDTPAEEFRYLRIPADERGEMDGWLRLRTALLDPAARARAAHAYAAIASPADKPQLRPQLEATAARALALFAGATGIKPGQARPADGGWGGLPTLSQFVESEVPEAERQHVSEVLLRILNGSLYELYRISRADAGLAPPDASTQTERFMVQAALALSDSMYYPAPVLLRLDDFRQVQASVFQVARAPGSKLVYLGAILLIVGVFAMLWVKERRVWVWLEPAPGRANATRVRMALSSTRESPDTAAEFEQLRHTLLPEEGP